MKIKNAVQRLGWRFGEAAKRNDNSFRLNPNDVEALERIDAYVVEKEKEQFADNELFAKMFILFYKKVLQDEGTTVMDNHARRKICKFLDKPLNLIIQDFTDFLNESEQYKLLQDAGVEMKHPALVSEDGKVSNNQKLQQAINTPEELDKFLGKVFEFDFVQDCLISEVNQAIELCQTKQNQ